MNEAVNPAGTAVADPGLRGTAIADAGRGATDAADPGRHRLLVGRVPHSGPDRFGQLFGEICREAVEHLGAEAPIPAVGCSFWLDRIVGRP